MKHTIRFFIGIILIVLGVMGVWTATRPSKLTRVDIPPAELPDPTLTPMTITATLTNVLWQTTLVGNQAVLSEAPITLVFTTEGNLTGSDGCNTLQTEYQISEPAAITIAEVFSATQKSCSEAVQSQATKFKNLLTQVDRYEILGSNLNLFIGDQVVLIMTALTDPLIGNWQVESMIDAQNQLAPVLPETQLTMEFALDGTVFGSSGCNTYTAEYTNLGGHQLTINQPATTLMFCEAPVGVAEQEQQFTANLSQITGYQAQADQLILTGSEGQTIISLIAKPIPNGLNPPIE